MDYYSLYVYFLIFTVSNSYYLSPNHLTWDEASSFCKNWCNSELASIHNKSQNDAMQNVIKSGYSAFDDKSHSNAVFIGLHDDKTISNFKWGDNTLFDFGNTFYEYPWLTFPPQPDSIDNINCVQIRVNNNFGWDDTACSRERRFICNSCSGKLNKYIILKREYDYTDANLKCNQIGTTLAQVHSKLDMLELQSLCASYNKPSDCWIGFQNNDINEVRKLIENTSFDYSNLLIQYPINNDVKQFARIDTHDENLSMQTANIDTIARAICNIPSELCKKSSRFVSFNGDIRISNDCNAILSLFSDTGRCDGIIYNKQYINEDRVVLIDYLFKMSDNGRGGIILPITTCFAYYIGISLNGNDQKLFLQYIEYNGSDTDYNITPLVQKKLQYSFNSTMYHLLSIKIEQIFQKVKFTLLLNNDNHFEALVCEHSSKLDLYSISVGIWSENSLIHAKSLYVSGTSMNVVSDGILPICMLPTANPTKTNNDLITSYGILISITFNQKLNINDTEHIIVIIKRLTNTLVTNYTTIPSNCIDSDPLNIKSQNKYNQTIVSGSIFVCSEQQQQQLLIVFNTNQHILSQIINDISQQYGLYISLNSTHLDTHIITIYAKEAINTTITLINDINSRSYVEHYTDEVMSIILIVIVCSLAGTAVITACSLVALNCIKIHFHLKDDHINHRNMEMNIADGISIASPTTSNVTTTQEPVKMNNFKFSVINIDQKKNQSHLICIERKKVRSLYNKNSNEKWIAVTGGNEQDEVVIGSSVPVITEGNCLIQEEEEIVRPYIVDSVVCQDIEMIGEDEIETPKCPKYAMV